MSLFFGKIFSATGKIIIGVIISLGLINTPSQPKTNIALKLNTAIQNQTVNTQLDLLKKNKKSSNNNSAAVQQKNSNIIKVVIPQALTPSTIEQNEVKTPLITTAPIPATTQAPTLIAPNIQPSPQIIYVPISEPAPAPIPTPTPTPTPQPQPSQPSPVASEPAPTEISIQNQVCNLSQTNVKTEYILDNDHLLANGNSDGRIFMNAYILNQQGQNYYNDNPTAKMTITTSDHSNDKVLNGSGNTGPCGFYYPFQFYATQKGTYTIDYSALGLSKSVTITIK